MNINITCEQSKEVLHLLKGNSYYTSSSYNCILLLRKLGINDFILNYNNEYIECINGEIVIYSDSILKYENKHIKAEENNRITIGSYEQKEFLRRLIAFKKNDDIKIDNIDKLIVDTYRLFFNKNPDFKDENVRKNVQVIAYFLQLVLSPISYSTYFTRFCEDAPYNELIEEKMDKLEALVDSELDDLKINDKIKKNIVSLLLRLKNKYEKETLLDIVKLYHEYYQTSDPSKESIKLIKLIKEKE